MENLIDSLDSSFLEKIRPILYRGGFTSVREALKEQALLLIYDRINQYENECNYFYEKYKTTYEKVLEKTEAEKGKENFILEDDLLDWRFALEMLQKLRQIKLEIENA